MTGPMATTFFSVLQIEEHGPARNSYPVQSAARAGGGLSNL